MQVLLKLLQLEVIAAPALQSHNRGRHSGDCIRAAMQPLQVRMLLSGTCVQPLVRTEVPPAFGIYTALAEVLLSRSTLWRCAKQCRCYACRSRLALHS
jgi:hypothetical protein